MRILLLSTALLLGVCGTTAAQDQQATNSSEGSNFTSENAIVDTSIPFAIGAREARQELRGAFGWPTFQEGLVEGVYFRFDPDGYARFAPTPRLDTDVFEVICRPGTLNCLGRKGSLSVYLNGQGALQLQLQQIAEGDSLFIVEGVTELPLPRSVLMPLDARMETLLGTGGELVARRGQQEVSRLSLAGFSAVSAYLRWITARQDYNVLPRGWPVPNSSTPQGDPVVTNWQAPIRSGQSEPIFEREVTATADPVASDVAEVRGELNVLRELLVARSAAERPPSAAQTDSSPAAEPNVTAEIRTLRETALALMEEIEQLQLEGTGSGLNQSETSSGPASQNSEAAPNPLAAAAGAGPAGKDKAPGRVASQLEYLMTEIGLDAETALMLVETDQTSYSGAADPVATAPPSESDVVLDILEELREQLPENDVIAQAPKDTNANWLTRNVSEDEYQLLTDYFRSEFQN